MKILILDDEVFASDFIEKLIIDNFKDCEVVGKAQTVKEATALYRDVNPDILIMDINLGDHISFELFEYINPSELIVIFTTSYQEYALMAIKVDAVDYLMKPVNIFDFKISLEKAKERIRINQLKQQDSRLVKFTDETTKNFIVLWENDKVSPIELSTVIKIKSNGSYSEIYINDDKKLFSSKSIGVYEALLQDKSFIRIHNTCLVNTTHILHYKPGNKAFLILSDNNIEYVSRNKKRNLLRYLNGRGKSKT